jgi:predicted TPR repeat methyltransferase
VPILHPHHVQHLLDLGCGTGNDGCGSPGTAIL